MAIRSPREVPKAQRVAMFGWCWPCTLPLFTGYARGGLLCRCASREILKQIFAVHPGAYQSLDWRVLLAGVLAAIMSTGDSQLLVCSSVISENFYKGMIKPGASIANWSTGPASAWWLSL